MRYLIFICLVSAAFPIARAHGTPFDPAVVPAQADTIGHLDVDALRATQLFTAVGGQHQLDTAIDQLPADLKAIGHTVAASLRGISFWRDHEHGAIYIATRDGRALGLLMTAASRSKPQLTAGAAIDGVATWTSSNPSAFEAIVGDTLVLADTTDSLTRSIRALGGKVPGLARSAVPKRAGLFMVVAIGADAISEIQKSAHSKVLQLGIKAVAFDAGEQAGVITANLHGDMATADAGEKAKGILEGLRALGSLSSDPTATALLAGVTITSTGTAVDVSAHVPVADLAKQLNGLH